MTTIKKFWAYMTDDKIFFLAFLLALVSIIFGNFRLSYINFEVILSLFGMMLVLGMFSRSGFLDNASRFLLTKSKNSRMMAALMWLFAFFISMVLSNDVAVLTILPLYLSMVRSSRPFKGSILGAGMITLAANLGGITFPFSNPQNLIIYQENHIPAPDFMKITIPLTLVSLLLICFTFFLVEKVPLNQELKSQPVNKADLGLGLLTFFIMIGAIFGVFPVEYAVLVLVIFFLIFCRPNFKNVDYRLLLTFICFFMIVGNISESRLVLDFLKPLTESKVGTFFSSLILSQFISNVPTTILLNPLSPHIEALLYGVNIGGLGSLLASLANLIGFNVFKSQGKSLIRPYLKSFTLINFFYLIILSAFYLIFIL